MVTNPFKYNNRFKNKSILLLITIFLLTDCNSLKKIEGKEPVFSLQKTACYGTCPVYELKIYKNRTATLKAEEFLDIKGNYYTKLDKKTFLNLVETFEESSFFEFKNNYDGKMSDFPTTITSFNNGKKSKTIRNYFGAPEELKELEKLLSELVKSEKWVTQK